MGFVLKSSALISVFVPIYFPSLTFPFFFLLILFFIPFHSLSLFSSLSCLTSESSLPFLSYPLPWHSIQDKANKDCIGPISVSAMEAEAATWHMPSSSLSSSSSSYSAPSFSTPSSSPSLPPTSSTSTSSSSPTLSIPSTTSYYRKSSSSQNTKKSNFLNPKLKPALFFTGRVHPGETPASWMMKGIIDFLIGDSVEASQLRHNYVIYIVPILNPDGVVFGNNRCSLAGN